MPLVHRAGFSVRRFLTLLFAVALVVPLLVALMPAPSSAAAALSVDQRRASDLLGASRRSAGVKAMAVCSDLSQVAQSWSQKMAASGKLAHNPAARDQIAGWSAWAENVGVGGSVDVVHGALLKSPGHRANMLSSSLTQVGVGVAQGGGRTWVTQVFRRPKSGQGCTAPAAPARPLPSGVARVQGTDRYQTAVALSQASFKSASTVIIASGDRFPDALAAAPLSADLGAPVLLTRGHGLHSATKAEIRRLGASRAVLLGSTHALSAAIERDLKGLRLGVERLAGPDRYATAAAIASRVGGRTVVIANGTNDGWADAIAATGYAAHQRLPVLLVDGANIAPPTLAALERLNVSTAVIVGGPAAVSTGVERELVNRDIRVRRLAGPNRLGTSAEVAEASVASGMSVRKVWLSTSRNWADALSAGPAVARSGGVLLLADPRRVSSREPTGLWLERHSRGIRDIVLVGGARAVNDQVGHDVAGILRN